MKYLESLRPSYLKSVFGMARIIPSLHLGGRFYQRFFPRRGNLLLYITNRCNSKCLICDHWEQQPKVDMSVRLIEDLIHSKTVGKHNWLVEGGEVFCHPDIDGILALLYKHKVNYTLFTNGILTDKLVRAIERYKIRSVNISLDGTPGVYKEVRGIDAYNNVIESIQTIKNKTNLQVVFTASPWNTYSSYLWVQHICDRENVRLMFNIYSEAAKSGKKGQERLIDLRYIKDNISPYVTYYNAWLWGLVRIPCYSSLFTIPVFPDGSVNICVSKFNPIGNIYYESIDDLWNSDEVIRLQRENLKCNACWVSCYRNFDIKLALLKGKIH